MDDVSTHSGGYPAASCDWLQLGGKPRWSASADTYAIAQRLEEGKIKKYLRTAGCEEGRAVIFKEIPVIQLVVKRKLVLLQRLPGAEI